MREDLKKAQVGMTVWSEGDGAGAPNEWWDVSGVGGAYVPGREKELFVRGSHTPQTDSHAVYVPVPS
jgi:hypothetical protein